MSISASVEAKALFSSKMLLQQLKSYINNLSNTSNSEELTKFIQTEFFEFTKYYMAVGDQEYRNKETEAGRNRDEIYVMHFALSEVFKDFMLLHRDVFLQLQISHYRIVEATATKEMQLNHFESCKDVLLNIANNFLDNIGNVHIAIYKSEKGKGKLLNGIKHSKNPWEIYKSQFETILEQTKSITNNSTTISRTLKVFEYIKTHHNSFLTEVISDVENLKKYSGEAIKHVKDLDNPEENSTTLIWIDNTLRSTSKEAKIQELYSSKIEDKLKTLTEISLPIDVENGLLLTKKIDFNKTVKKWFDFEILPSIIDLLENKKNMISYFKHSLLNLKSSLIVEKNNKSSKLLPSQLQTLQNVHSTLSQNATNINKIIKEVDLKFKEQFQFTKVFTHDDFLEVSLQSSLSQFATRKTNILTDLKNRLTGSFSNFNSKYEQSKLFSKKNNVEDTIQAINYRMFKENDAHYDTLFLNKNFIGDLFLLPRKQQENMVVRSIDQWKSGFNKAALVTGDALSGKTTFVEYIGEKYFGKNVIHLRPDSPITFGGRKFNITRDLKEILQNIKKGFPNTRSLILIEDLELWKDAENSLLDNVRSLISFVASESDNAFILVTTSKQMQQHLDKRVRFTEAFSTSIDVNKSTFEEIYKALMLRHGASHKILVSKDKEVLSTKQIEQRILKLSRKNNYNIGEVLQAWTYGTTMLDNNHVIYEDRDIGIKDFFNSEELMILKYIFLYMNLSEIELKNFVGPAYENGYKSSLKRLINTKILIRDTEGLLVLNSVLVMEVKQLLIYKGILS